ncbi:MAG TPA: DUF427 domain-containing protein [Nocardioidaceae bacterium]|nr:DUF427 domain-containing protein [Nocardioidaceae bacterium]
MALTLDHGPLSTTPPREVNYSLDGPDHLLLFETFPRRVRAVFAGETIADTTDGKLLHESGHLPVLYIPDADLREDLLVPSGHTTYCPFKGDAAYWSPTVGDTVADNAVWAYPEPRGEASWLRGHKAFSWDAMEAWYDEDERVEGHLRDPYHRVDVRRTSRHVRVLHGDDVLAETDRAVLLSETGLPNMFYLPPEDVRADRLVRSVTSTVCPYKGTASYWSLAAGDGGVRVADVAWCYPDPLENALKARGYLCFAHPDVRVEVA